MSSILSAFGAIFFNSRGSAVSKAKSKDGAVAENQGRGAVLAIDDDAGTLDVLRPLLAAEGFTVLTAQSAAKGLDMLRYCQRDVRVVVLDYNMPRFNGGDALAHVRRLSPRVKVLALTGVEACLLPENFRTGVDKILAKPYSTAELLDSINALLGYDPRAAVAKS